MSRRLWKFGTVGLLVVSAVACGGDDDDGSATAPSPAPTRATNEATATTQAPETTEASATTEASETTELATTASPDAGEFAPQPLAEPASVSISVSGGVASFLPIILAEALGEFDRENLDVTIEVLPATEGTLLVSQGRLDAAAVAVNAGNLNLIGGGVPIRFAFPYEPEYPPEVQGGGFWARKDVVGEDGSNLEALRGQPIATSTGISSALLGYFWLNFLNVDGQFPISDLNAQQVANPDAAEALKGGGIAASTVFSPFQTTLKQERDCCVYLEGTDVPFPLGWVLIGERLYETDRDVSEAFFRAVARTTVTYLQGDYINDPEIGPAIAEALGQPLDVLKTVDQPIWDPSFPIDPAGALTLQAYFREIPGVLEYDTPLTPDDAFDVDLYNAVLQDR